ncbi:glycosyltransferase family 2 protein [Patescibacteria group bacterium]|nr:glycosyltransferase family 2 protein [Patescibacteria group bacterium]
MKLSIITVNWNVCDLLSKLLDSISYFTAGIDYEVIVVDNDSKDGSAEHLKSRYADRIESGKLKIIENKYNAGFAKANNQGLHAAKGEYVLFMNPDMELLENSFPMLVDFMDGHEHCGICTCKLLYKDKQLQPNVKGSPTLCSQILILLKSHHFLSDITCLKKYLMKDFNYEKQADVDQVMGAFVFTRKNLMDSISGWDEDYWLMWEDVELCAKVKNLGYDIIYSPATAVIHYESKSFEQVPSLKKQKRFNRGMLIYFKKHQPFIKYFILILFQPISFLLAAITQLLKIKQRPQSRI